MNLIEIPYNRNEKRWYSLSSFYAREMWAELINEIMHFYRERRNQFSNCLISFSVEKGEHLQVTFVTPEDDYNNYTNEIQTHFLLFLEQQPSISKTQFPFGKAVWGNYPNNSLAWTGFKLPEYSEQYIEFHQKTFEVALKLLANDFSEDNFFSLGIYLLTKALCRIGEQEQANVLSQALRDASIGSPHFVYTAKELITGININEIGEAVESYRNEDTDEYSLELTNWLNEVKTLLKLYNYSNLCNFICEIIGLKGLRHLMILELMSAAICDKIKINND